MAAARSPSCGAPEPLEVALHQGQAPGRADRHHQRGQHRAQDADRNAGMPQHSQRPQQAEPGGRQRHQGRKQAADDGEHGKEHQRRGHRQQHLQVVHEAAFELEGDARRPDLQHLGERAARRRKRLSRWLGRRRGRPPRRRARAARPSAQPHCRRPRPGCAVPADRQARCGERSRPPRRPPPRRTATGRRPRSRPRCEGCAACRGRRCAPPWAAPRACGAGARAPPASRESTARRRARRRPSGCPSRTPVSPAGRPAGRRCPPGSAGRSRCRSGPSARPMPPVP